MTELDGLPGSRRFLRGIRDLTSGKSSVEALLVAVASRRLAELGLPLPAAEDLPREPELLLYELLCSQSQDPFFAYGALLGELDSFISSLEARAASRSQVRYEGRVAGEDGSA